MSFNRQEDNEKRVIILASVFWLHWVSLRLLSAGHDLHRCRRGKQTRSMRIAPPTALLGGTFTVNWTRRNVGSAATFVAGQDQIFLGTSPNSTSGARWLATAPGAILVPGAEASMSQRVTIPLETALPAGNYYVLVAVDSPDAQPESNETNNLGASAITLSQPPLPDLGAVAFSPPSQLIPGAPVDLSWQVTNAGTLGLTDTVWHERIAFSNATVGLIVLAEFPFTNTLAAGDFLTRTQAVVFPATQPAEPGYLLVI